MPRYTPKMSPVPVNAVRLRKDFHAKAGSWIAITEDGRVLNIGHDTFTLMYNGRPDETIVAPVAEPRRSKRIFGEWVPGQHQFKLLHAMGRLPRDTWVTTPQAREQLAPEDRITVNIAGRCADLLKSGFIEKKQQSPRVVFYRITETGWARIAQDTAHESVIPARQVA